MATARDLRRISLLLEGTTEAPHFDRTAFKAARIYATLAADGKTANLRFTPDEQELKCLVAPEAFVPIPNAWGRQGWTCVTLAALSSAELKAALEMAWSHATPASRPKARDRSKTGAATPAAAGAGGRPARGPRGRAPRR
jgi:hypothetical protein